jgi:hypothetical protein
LPKRNYPADLWEGECEMKNDNSQIVQDALKYVDEAYGFMLEKGYEVFSAKDIPMGWQVVLRKQDLFVRILQMRNEEEVHFHKTTQPPADFGLDDFGSGKFVDMGSVVYAATGEIIPTSYGSHEKDLQKYLDKIETYFEGEYVINEDSLKAAQKETLEAISPKEPKTIPILHYPLMGIIILLLVGALTTLYAVLLDRLFSALSMDVDAYRPVMGMVSLLLAIGTILAFRRRRKKG